MAVSSTTRQVVEGISTIAVVLSLVLVAMEVRNSAEQTALNSAALQIATYQDLVGRISDLNLMVMSSPEWATLQGRMAAAPESITDVQSLQQVQSYVFLILRHGDMAYYQFESGFLTEERLESAVAPLRTFARNPHFLALWDARRSAFTASYQRYVDSLIAVGF